MSEALKRFEEKHDRECHRCFDPEDPGPCDVVRLARALDATLHSLKALHTTLGASKSPWVKRVLTNSKARTTFVGAERILREVAGE